MQQMQPIKSVGKLVAANANQIQSRTRGPDDLRRDQRRYQVSVTGTADLDYLKSGVTVEFVAEVAKGGTVKEKITHLTVISPTTIGPLACTRRRRSPEKKAAKDEDRRPIRSPDKAPARRRPTAPARRLRPREPNRPRTTTTVRQHRARREDGNPPEAVLRSFPARSRCGERSN